MSSLILLACFLPLIILFVVLKLAVWVDAVNAEQKYVIMEDDRERGPYNPDAYADVDADEEA